MTITSLTIAVAIYVAYLIGSLSSAIIVCKLMRLPDPRKTGSRNPGATNVLRIGGKYPALLTLLGDMLKGLLPVLVAKYLGFPPIALALIALAAILGHLFPIFFKFYGGKGVATTLGCLFALSWPVGVCWLVIWLCMAFIFRYSSLAALIATFFAPFAMWYFTENVIYTWTIGLVALIIVLRHHQNIHALATGKESKIGSKKP